MKYIAEILLLVAIFSGCTGAIWADSLSGPLSEKSGHSIKPLRGFTEVYGAIEVVSLRMSLSEKLTGFIVGSVCDSCETIKVRITPRTKAFSDDAEVPLKKAKSRIGRYATVIYALDTKEVKSINW